MRKIHAIPIFAVLVLTVSFSVPQVFAVASITLTPDNGPVSSTTTISGSGFTQTNVWVFFDNKLVDSDTVKSGGLIDIIGVPIPTVISGIPVLPGTHTISISSSPDTINLLASASFTVTSPISIPDFPFSFSLVIMFVAVAGVYLAIRQKMTTRFFKPF